MNGYELSRKWFDFCFKNPELIKPNHTALYFFIVEHCNRLGWKQKFGLPTTMAKEAIGIRSYNTYITTLNDLIEFGFVKMIEKSQNQYSSNIVALSYFNKPHDKPLDNALINHGSKQDESTDSIDKPITNKQQLLSEFKKWGLDSSLDLDKVEDTFLNAWDYYKDLNWKNKNGKPIKDIYRTIRTVWFKDLSSFKKKIEIDKPTLGIIIKVPAELARVAKKYNVSEQFLIDQYNNM